jgi:hypothetical protein
MLERAMLESLLKSLAILTKPNSLGMGTRPPPLLGPSLHQSVTRGGVHGRYCRCEKVISRVPHRL